MALKRKTFQRYVETGLGTGWEGRSCQDAIDAIKKACEGDTSLTLEDIGGWDYCDLQVVFVEQEPDKEYQKRVAVARKKAATIKAKQEAAEIAELERLKKKYG